MKTINDDALARKEIEEWERLAAKVDNWCASGCDGLRYKFLYNKEEETIDFIFTYFSEIPRIRGRIHYDPYEQLSEYKEGETIVSEKTKKKIDDFFSSPNWLENLAQRAEFIFKNYLGDELSLTIELLAQKCFHFVGVPIADSDSALADLVGQAYLAETKKQLSIEGRGGARNIKIKDPNEHKHFFNLIKTLYPFWVFAKKQAIKFDYNIEDARLISMMSACPPIPKGISVPIDLMKLAFKRTTIKNRLETQPLGLAIKHALIIYPQLSHVKLETLKKHFGKWKRGNSK